MDTLKQLFPVLFLSAFCLISFNACTMKPKGKTSFKFEPYKRATYNKNTQLTMKLATLGPINERVGLIIAPDNYKNAKFHNSGYIQESFEIILSAMDDKFDYVYSTSSTNADFAINKKTIGRCISSCNKNTLLVVFLAGQIVKTKEKYYLLNYDSEPEDIPKTSLNIKEILETLSDSGCGRILVFADLYPKDKNPGELIKYITKLPSFGKKYDLSREMRLLVTNFSAKGKPYRFYVGFQGADIFSWYLALGLRGQADKIISGGNNDGKTSIIELIQYMREEMANSLVYKQKPSSSGKFLPNTVVVK